jgi:hypothetical protein
VSDMTDTDSPPEPEPADLAEDEPAPYREISHRGNPLFDRRVLAGSRVIHT